MKKHLRFILLLLISFLVCRTINAQAPVNDDCTGATNFALTPFGAACSSAIVANTEGATKSSPNPSCTSSLNDDDIWYTFQATTESIVVHALNATYNSTGQAAQIGFSLYGGACQVTNSNLTCSNLLTAGAGYLIINGLVPGDVYYLRFWSASSTLYATFEFCVQEVMQPANDDCVNAIQIISQPNVTICSATYNSTTVGATRSSFDPGCTNFNDDDIWYSFTANTNGVRLNFSNAKQATSVSGNANLGYAIYESACPSGAVSSSCNPNIGAGSGSELIGGLTPGNTYYMRLFSYGTNNYMNFDFCLVDEVIVENDDCINAIDIPVTNGFCTSPVAGDLSNATTSAGFGSPACTALSSSEDVWFKTTVPSSGTLIIQTSAADDPRINDLVMEAYSGSCAALSLITCDDNSNPDAAPSDHHSRITLSARAPAEIIYLRVLGKGTINDGPFIICAWDPSSLPPVSDGGNCINGNIVAINSLNKNQFRWVPLFDNTGNIIAEIYGDGNDLGNITPGVFVNTSGTVRNNNGKFYLDRNITLSPENNASANVRLYIKNSELNELQAADPSVISVNSLNVTKTDASCQPAFSGIASVIVPDAYMDYGADHYVQFSTPSFSSFYMHSANVTLPLKFISFSADKNNSGITLTWRVIKDNSIKDFEIEHSGDGINFFSIDFLKANGFVSHDNDSWTFSYFHKNAFGSKIFYRIKMNDKNDKSIYSKIISVSPQSEVKILSVYPNPLSGKIFLRLNNNAANIYAKVFDVTGKLVMDFGKRPWQDVMELNLGELRKGVYILQVTDRTSKKTFYEKIILE